ncbi:hypothetical protein O4J55_07370 [Paracoccus sp. PXZ]
MFLIVLAIALTIAAGFIAFKLAVFALPFWVAMSVFQYMHGTDTGIFLPGLAAFGGAIASVVFVIAVLAFASNPFVRLVALGLFAIPATIAGYALIYGIAKNAIDSSVALNILGGIGGIVIGGSAMAHLNAIGVAFFSRI